MSVTSLPEISWIIVHKVTYKISHFPNQGSEKGQPQLGYERFPYTFTRGFRLSSPTLLNLNKRAIGMTLGQSGSLRKKIACLSYHDLKKKHYALKECN